jgi:ATP-binding cassette subfamily C (CFTR/MRP) protein 4
VRVGTAATASCDPDTDNQIQRLLRTSVGSCTVLTIAHRLPTIIDYDCVLVLDGGKVAEFDHPHVLLQRRDGVFAGMVASTGVESEAMLRAAAAQAYAAQQSSL